MLAGVLNFISRHRRKFLFAGGLLGGAMLLSKYAEYKLFQWHNNQTQAIIEKQKRKQHYERTRQTANATGLNLSNCLIKIVCDELQVDDVIQAIRSNPENKLKLWQDLKILGFSRCVGTVYAAALAGAVVNANLMLLGGYTFGEIGKNDKSRIYVGQVNEEKYLSHLQNFVEKGLPKLMQNIRLATEHFVSSLRLEQLISLEHLEGILKDIVLLLEGEYLLATASNCPSFQIQPWSHYVVPLAHPSIPKTSEEAVFQQMTDEMLDVIDGEDFSRVVQKLIRYGINHVLDYIADFYPQPALSTRVINPSEQNRLKESCVDETTESNNAELSKVAKGDGNKETKQEEQFVNMQPLVKSTIPLAKLVPVMSELIHPCLSPAPGQLLQFVLLNEQLENLSFNIYEAFSTPAK